VHFFKSIYMGFINPFLTKNFVVLGKSVYHIPPVRDDSIPVSDGRCVQRTETYSEQIDGSY
jgi:hypothetical protein